MLRRVVPTSVACAVLVEPHHIADRVTKVRHNLENRRFEIAGRDDARRLVCLA